MKRTVLCSLALFICFPAYLYANADIQSTSEIKNISDSLEVKKLKEDISRNLRETARTGKLAAPLYFVKYRLKKNEHFYYVMAKMSQNMDTLSTLNQLPAPGAVGPGDELMVPSARGVFIHGDSKSKIAENYKTGEDRLIPVSKSLWFLPGGTLPQAELRVFRGDDFLQPLKNIRVTSRYGYRRDPFSRRSTFHGGIDLGASAGTAVYASKNGKVIRAESAGGYGNLVVISHEFGYSTYYGHLSKIFVRNGQTVRAGDRIGLVGSTGKANGPHLHFEIRKSGLQKNPRFVHHAAED